MPRLGKEKEEEVARLTAMLRAVLRVLEDNGRIPFVLNHLNEETSGVTSGQLMIWWERHKAMDAADEEQRRLAEVLAEQRRAALAKLSPEEIALLNLKEFDR